MKYNFLFALAVPLYFAVSLGIFYVIHNAQTAPYIDEEFHVPQAQKYCEGRYSEWDIKITTPPGLYAASVLILQPLFWFRGIVDCSIFHLRLVNVLATTGNFILLYLIKQKLFNKRNNVLALIEACSLASFPILYFFSFLYYTDAVSTFFVLKMYLMYLHDQNFMAAMAGLMATGVRQTNIIWTAYFAGLKAYSALTEALQGNKKSSAKRKKTPFAMILEGLMSPRVVFIVVKKTFWYILVGAAFIAFVVWNGSIVVGDKTAHEATFHLPQVFYFLSCVAFFSPLQFTRYASRFLHLIKKQKLKTLLLLSIFLIAVHLNTLTHPYLLADNRHYTFYIWKRVFEAHWWAKYALCPFYVYCFYFVNDSLKPQGPVVRFLIIVCVLATLIPQRLLEPRYFILPYLMIKLHMSTRSRMSAVIDFALTIAVNAATIYIYTACPFATDSCVRFIW